VEEQSVEETVVGCEASLSGMNNLALNSGKAHQLLMFMVMAGITVVNHWDSYVCLYEANSTGVGRLDKLGTRRRILPKHCNRSVPGGQKEGL